MIQFDHIEVHVKNSKLYAEFLIKLFGNGRIKRISDNNTYMFLSQDNLHIEIKERATYEHEFDVSKGIGFCLPCLRMVGAYQHLSAIPEITVINKVDNPDGPCYFFRDYEGIDWHIKDYCILDIYVNI
ncbi:MAG: hypothetical protein ACN4EP_04270 [Sediminibacterium sp.]